MTAIGYVTHNPEKDTYRGNLTTVTFNTAISILPNGSKGNDNHPDYRVFTDRGFEIGAGWLRTGKTSNKEYVSLSLSAPELPKKIFANLGTAAGVDEDNVFALIWNPDS